MFLVDMTFTDISKVTPEVTELHKAYLAKEYASNNLLFGGRKVPRTGGILISQHASKEELLHVLEHDPFVQTGVMEYTITEFSPMMASQPYQHILLE